MLPLDAEVVATPEEISVLRSRIATWRAAAAVHDDEGE
ncbi:MAG: hypothetical protein AVDCRST_MAG64-914 [uncultured Phycisphaerae bacterium]|uniref:Uncharacterized protein n=1 Tax=uncultured Phycisphaerae bacterium TaxID=904963 RepID=A0A6J4NDP2_9BACT|nr:MAG: hypothetical protein AVDCRST_MAG64-914 [uncultured Phycisphaerae bacterium]